MLDKVLKLKLKLRNVKVWFTYECEAKKMRSERTNHELRRRGMLLSDATLFHAIDSATHETNAASHATHFAVVSLKSYILGAWSECVLGHVVYEL